MATYTNFEMETMVERLSKHLDRRDVIGYAAARNTRKLADELREYTERKNALILEYGEKEVDADGNETGNVVLPYDSPNFAKFADELEQFAKIEHAPDLMTLDYGQAIGLLSGTELLEIEFMFKEE